MAEQVVGLRFEGNGDLIPFLQEARENVNGLRKDHGQASAGIQADLRGTANEAKQTNVQLNAASQLVVALAKSVGQGLPALTKNLKDVAAATDQVRGALTSAEKANFSQVNNALREIAAREGIIIKAVSNETQARIQALVATQKISAEEAKLLLATEEAVQTFRELKAQAEELPLPIEETEHATKSLVAQFREAKNEAAQLAAAGKQNTSEYNKAATEAARLEKIIADTGGRIKALNPGDKVAAFSQLGGAIAGGAQAISGFAIALGGNNQELQESLFKLQSVLFAVQGAQSFLKDFKDSFENVKAVLGLTTPIQEALTEAVEAGTVAEKASVIATEEKSAVDRASLAVTEAKAAAAEVSAVATERVAEAEGASVVATQASTVAKAENVAITEAGVIASEAGAEATAAGVVASEADVVAKEAQAVANTAATATTGLLTTAVELFTVAIEANPILLAVVAIAALALIVVNLTDNVEDGAHAFDRLNDGIDEAIRKQTLLRQEAQKLDQLTGAQKLAEVERQLIEQTAGLGKTEADRKIKEGVDTQRRLQIEADGIKELGRLEQARNEEKIRGTLAANRVLILAGELTEALNDRDAKKVTEITEKVKQASDVLANSKEEVFKLNNEIVANGKKTTTELADFDNENKREQLDRERDLAKRTLDIRQSLAESIRLIEVDLRDQILALEQAQADPGRALQLEKEATEARLALKEQELRREIALEAIRVRVGTEAFEVLSDLQRRAAADAEIAGGGGQLSLVQQEQFNSLRLRNEEDYFIKRAALENANTKTLLSLQAEGAQKQRNQLTVDLIDRAEELRKAGASQAQIEADATKKRLALDVKLAQDTNTIQEQIQLDTLAAQVAGGVQNEQTERANQLAVLAIKVEFAEKALALIEDDGSETARARIAAARRVVEELKGELGKLKAQAVPFDLFDLLGITLSEENKQKALAALDEIGQAVEDIVAANMDARQRELDAELAANSELISASGQRLEDLKAQLEKEEDLRKQGLANNVDATLAAIQAEKKAGQDALTEKKRIQAEQQKLARQQVIFDSISQGSSLATGVANLIKTWSTIPFGIGLISAFAQAASIISFFTGIKGKLASTQQLKTGTKSVQLMGHPDGEDTVPAMLTKGEGVVPVHQNVKYAPFVSAIIDDDFSRLTPKQLAPILDHIDLSDLLEGTGVVVNEKATREVVRMNQTYIDGLERGSDMTGVEKRLEALTEKVETWSDRDKKRERSITHADGRTVVRTPGHVTIHHPK